MEQTQKHQLERKIHTTPHPEKYRLSNNRKRTKGRIKLGSRIQSIPIWNSDLRTMGYIYQFHSNK
jgi:hypothetical protein